MTSVAARNKSARARGKRFESDLRDDLRAEGLDVEKTPDTGTFDEGDLMVRHAGHRYVVEAKNVASIDLAGFVGEALVEADHYVEHRPGLGRDEVTGLAVIKRRGKGTLDSYVVTTLREFFKIGRSS